MSKLLLSTSMVVALMAINPALHAEDPKPMPVEPSFDQIQESPAVTGDEATLKAEEPQVKSGEEAADKTMDSIAEEKKAVDTDSKLTVAEKKEIDDSIDALEGLHKLFDEAIQSAEELKDDPAAQKEAFKDVDDQAAKVSDEAVKLADLLKQDDQNDPNIVAMEKDVKDELGDVTADKANEDVVGSVQENLQSAVGSEDKEITKDADLTPAEISQIDKDSANHAQETADKITASLKAAEDLKTGLNDAGLDPNDENVLKLKAAIANLKSILDGLFPEMKGKAVSKK